MIDKDSRFYRKFKEEMPLSNPGVIYRKRRESVLPDGWAEGKEVSVNRDGSNSERIKERDFERASVVSELDKDSRFYRKFKEEMPLSNPGVIYRKRRESVLPDDWAEKEEMPGNVRKLTRKKD